MVVRNRLVAFQPKEFDPAGGSDADHVRRVKEQHPELRVIPRVAAEKVEAMLEAGAEGAVVSFADEAAMRDFARRFR